MTENKQGQQLTKSYAKRGLGEGDCPSPGKDCVWASNSISTAAFPQNEENDIDRTRGLVVDDGDAPCIRVAVPPDLPPTEVLGIT
eukprot:6447031-Amphidinium_carterae.1